MTKLKALLMAAAVVATALAAVAAGQEAGAIGLQVRDTEETPFKTIVVPADAGWVDSGIDVLQGDEWAFRATGRITLQRGNPAAECGPEGLDFMTVQQPMPDRNTGALIGKVAQLVSVRVDESTGEEIRDEIISVFYIGPENDVFMPIRGRLYFGVNENVVQDNAGSFVVSLFRGESGAAPGRD
jgi:hypothetical protein